MQQKRQTLHPQQSAEAVSAQIPMLGTCGLLVYRKCFSLSSSISHCLVLQCMKAYYIHLFWCLVQTAETELNILCSVLCISIIMIAVLYLLQ